MTPASPRLGPRWADLVFHVLAHVRATASLPSSLYDPEYCAFADRHLGPAGGRALGADAEILGRIATDHGSLAGLQSLAWAFSHPERVSRLAGRDLASLDPSDLDDPRWLDALRRGGPTMEVLRAAAELEEAAFEQLPAPVADLTALGRALSDLARGAPGLRWHRVECVRSLRSRGRVAHGVVWVGAPAPEPSLDVHHAAWQACHEATVAEVARAFPTLAERAVEHVALVLLATRAGAGGRGEGHARWYAAFGGGASSTDLSSLPGPLRGAAQSLLDR